MNPVHSRSDSRHSRFSGKEVVLFVGLTIIVTVLITSWWINRYLYAATFDPIQLTMPEQQILDTKMAKLHQTAEADSPSGTSAIFSKSPSLKPESYTEQESDREIHLTEREVNALIAKDQETAKHVAVDLADDVVSVQLLVPVDEKMPLVGGKTWRLNFGVMLRYAEGKPVVAMRGVSLGGVPIPSAWWGDIKNKNLIEEFGGPGGFWDQFAKGVEDIQIQDGELRVKLRE